MRLSGHGSGRTGIFGQFARRPGAPANQLHDCVKDDFQIHQQGVVGRVQQLKPQLGRADEYLIRLFGILASRQRGTLVEVPQRGPIRNAGTERQKPGFLLGIHGDILFNFRPGTNQAHLSRENVNQLR